MSDLESEFLLISEAVARLGDGMFGGSLKRPEPVNIGKKCYPRASIGWELHKQEAAALVDAAIMAEDMSVHVFVSSEEGRRDRSIQVPIETLRRLIRIRVGLPDHVIRPTVALLGDKVVTSELFAALSKSALYLQKSEFEAWYDQIKSRGRWPSQRTRTMPRVGRPTKHTDQLRTSIMARVEEGSWCAKQPVAKLERLLASKGAPKRNTLKRTVDQLYRETGDIRYLIIKRKRLRPEPVATPNI